MTTFPNYISGCIYYETTIVCTDILTISFYIKVVWELAHTAVEWCQTWWTHLTMILVYWEITSKLSCRIHPHNLISGVHLPQQEGGPPCENTILNYDFWQTEYYAFWIFQSIQQLQINSTIQQLILNCDYKIKEPWSLEYWFLLATNFMRAEISKMKRHQGLLSLTG